MPDREVGSGHFFLLYRRAWVGLGGAAVGTIDPSHLIIQLNIVLLKRWYNDDSYSHFDFGGSYHRESDSWQLSLKLWKTMTHIIVVHISFYIYKSVLCSPWFFQNVKKTAPWKYEDKNQPSCLIFFYKTYKKKHIFIYDSGWWNVKMRYPGKPQKSYFF